MAWPLSALRSSRGGTRHRKMQYLLPAFCLAIFCVCLTYWAVQEVSTAVGPRIYFSDFCSNGSTRFAYVYKAVSGTAVALTRAEFNVDTGRAGGFEVKLTGSEGGCTATFSSALQDGDVLVTERGERVGVAVAGTVQTFSESYTWVKASNTLRGLGWLTGLSLGLIPYASAIWLVLVGAINYGQWDRGRRGLGCAIVYTALTPFAIIATATLIVYAVGLGLDTDHTVVDGYYRASGVDLGIGFLLGASLAAYIIGGSGWVGWRYLVNFRS